MRVALASGEAFPAQGLSSVWIVLLLRHGRHFSGPAQQVPSPAELPPPALARHCLSQAPGGLHPCLDAPAPGRPAGSPGSQIVTTSCVLVRHRESPPRPSGARRASWHRGELLPQDLSLPSLSGQPSVHTTPSTIAWAAVSSGLGRKHGNVPSAQYGGSLPPQLPAFQPLGGAWSVVHAHTESVFVRPFSPSSVPPP